MPASRTLLWGPLSPLGLGVAALTAAVDQAHKAWMFYVFDIGARSPVRVAPLVMPSTASFTARWPISSRSTPSGLRGTYSISPIQPLLPGCWDFCMSPCSGVTKRPETLLRCRKTAFPDPRGGTLGRVKSITGPRRALGFAIAAVSTLALGGCGGIEFQGRVFASMGLSGDRQQGDVRMAERPPLLLPPNLKQLPQPGTSVAVATARPDWPTNPEVVQKQIAKDKATQEAKKEAD